MSIKKRRQKINNLMSSINPLIEKHGNIQYHVTGSNPNSAYHIHVNKAILNNVEGIKYFQYNCSCHKKSPRWDDCKGNDCSVCYHVLAAIKKQADSKLGKLVYAENFHDAVRLLNFGGKLIQVLSAQSQKVIWGVYN